MPFCQLYSSFEEYMADYCDYHEPDPETGKYGYWQNPNATWDWYLVGGRWTGLLNLKGPVSVLAENPGGEAWSGEPGLMTEPNESLRKADTALCKDIDWDAMMSEDWQDSYRIYTRIQECRSIILAEEGIDLEEHREAYEKWMSAFGEDEKPDRSLEEYALRRATVRKYEKVFDAKYERKALTYAFIDLEGHWCGRGKMGWWGISMDEQDSYDAAFWKFVESLPGDQRVFVVDCHI